MRTSKLFNSAIAVVIALATHLHAASLPYPAIPWEQFPDRQWSLEKYDPAVTYPNWDPSAFRFESYAEAEQSFGLDYGLAACQVYDPLWIAAVYYSPDGNAYISHEPLPLATGQRITLTWQLPPRENGISRLILLSSQPVQEDWFALLANPLAPTAPQVALVTEQWLGRKPVQLAQLPWVSSQRSLFQPPADYDTGSWPVCRAWLQPDLTIATKDCWVQTDAQPGFILDEYGPAGRWALDWSSEFRLGCQLYPATVMDAVLVLTGKAKPDFTGAGLPEIDLTANGWEIQRVELETSLANSLQQYRVEVGQYLQAGDNTFSVRINAVTGGILQLDNMELWIRRYASSLR